MYIFINTYYNVTTYESYYIERFITLTSSINILYVIIYCKRSRLVHVVLGALLMPSTPPARLAKSRGLAIL